MTEEEKQKEIQKLTKEIKIKSEELKRQIQSDPRILPVMFILISPLLYVLGYFIAKALS